MKINRLESIGAIGAVWLKDVPLSMAARELIGQLDKNEEYEI